MNRSNTIRALLVAVWLPVLIGAGDRPDRAKAREDQAIRLAPPVRETVGTDPAMRPSPHSASGEQTSEARSPLYSMKHFSVHTGGDAQAISTNLRAGVFAGETLLGSANSESYRANFGFWFEVVPAACPITLPGDVQQNGTISSADIIYLVITIFKGGEDPLPCRGAGDVNCSGTLSPADIIYLVNTVFKGGADACDMCTLIPATWPCP